MATKKYGHTGSPCHLVVKGIYQCPHLSTFNWQMNFLTVVICSVLSHQQHYVSVTTHLKHFFIMKKKFFTLLIFKTPDIFCSIRDKQSNKNKCSFHAELCSDDIIINIPGEMDAGQVHSSTSSTGYNTENYK